MQVPATITAARTSVLAAKQHIALASVAEGSSEVVDALRRTRVDISQTVDALRELSTPSRGACVIIHALDGLGVQLDGALERATTLDPDAGRLPVGSVDPVFEVLDDASTILFASRWG